MPRSPRPASYLPSGKATMPPNIANWNLQDVDDWDTEASIVYFIQSDYAVKIGTTTTTGFQARISALRSANPAVLHVRRCVYGDLKLEKRLHRYFAAQRIHYEWFRREGDLDRILAIENSTAALQAAALYRIAS